MAAQLVAIDVRTASALAFALGGALALAAGVLVSMFLTFNANLGVVFTLKALIVVIMEVLGNLLGALIAGLILGLVENYVAVFIDPGLTLGRDLRDLPDRAAGPAPGPARPVEPMSRHETLSILGGPLPPRSWPVFRSSSSATMACRFAINIVSYAVLATAWSLFSGPTRYVSLATVAFFGIGAYTTAVFAETLPWPAVLVIAAGIGVVVATLVGLSTLRPLGRLLRDLQLRPRRAGPPARDLVGGQQDPHPRGATSSPTSPRRKSTGNCWRWPCWSLWRASWIGRSRLGLALRAIGDDETVAARHTGIDTTRAKVALFVLSTVFMTLTGAIMAPRWTYIDPAIAFNPVVSFTVLIMALLGGVHRLYGPVLGVVPLALLFEFLLARFPNHFSIMVGLVFILIVYAIPRGIAGLVEQAVRRPA